LTSVSGLPIALYDCFSDTRFGGNVGGVVFQANSLSSAEMMQIARELNAAVTGFVTEIAGSAIRMRFFMPGAEIAMCGHVTVGVATHFAGLHPDAGRFEILAPAGRVPVEIHRTGDAAPRVMMQLAVPKPVLGAVDLSVLAAALRVPVTALETRAPVQAADAGLKHLFVHFESVADVIALKPDFAKLKAVSQEQGVQTIGCFAMTAQGDVYIRDFCPAVGVDEVPASGTTNGALAGYLVAHGFIAPQSGQIIAEQGSEIGRPSRIISQISVENGQLTDLWIGGQAVVSMRGALV